MTENYYILTSDGTLFHHGIKGMKWGVRRYQNKDGSLTPAGKKRLAKDLKRDYKRNRDYSRPGLTSDTYKKKLGDVVERSISPDDVKRITRAKERWLVSSRESEKTYDALHAVAKKYGNEFYDEQMRVNSDMYTSPKDKARLRDYATYEYGYEKARTNRPDLSNADNSAHARNVKDYEDYQEECRKVCDKILDKYGDTKLYSDRYYTLTIRDTVGNMVESMVDKKR
jgi:hypothetical protein